MRSPHYPPLSNRFLAALFFFGLILYLCVANALMTAMSIPYDEPTGNPIFKIHFATYLLLMTFVLAQCARGNPVESFVVLVKENRGISVYFFITVFLLLYSLIRYGASGVAFIVDTLMMPGVVGLLMLMFDDETKRRAYLLVLSLLVLNALIALVEAVLKVHIVPYSIGGIPVPEDIYFRSTALIGHPLKNALLIGTGLLVSLNLRIKLFAQLVLIGVMFIALLTYGGRTSFVLIALILTVYFSTLTFKKLIKGKYTYPRVMGGTIAVFLIISLLILVIFGTNIGSRIVETTTTYDNSASVRVHNWDALNFMSAADIVFGLSPKQIEGVVVRLGQIYNLQVIENFWLGLMMQLGAIGLTLLIIGFICLLVPLARRADLPARIAIIFFFIAASSNNALSTKNIALIVLVVLLIGNDAYRRKGLMQQRRLEPARRPAVRNHQSISTPYRT